MLFVLSVFLRIGQCRVQESFKPDVNAFYTHVHFFPQVDRMKNSILVHWLLMYPQQWTTHSPNSMALDRCSGVTWRSQVVCLGPTPVSLEVTNTRQSPHGGVNRRDGCGSVQPFTVLCLTCTCSQSNKIGQYCTMTCFVISSRRQYFGRWGEVMMHSSIY